LAPPQRSWNEDLSGGIFAAPRARVHPVIHATRAVRADAFELPIFDPVLLGPAPGAKRHRVLNPAAAARVALGVVAESLGSLERRLARVARLVYVRSAPGAERKPVRDNPAAAVAFRPGLAAAVPPRQGPRAIRAV